MTQKAMVSCHPNAGMSFTHPSVSHPTPRPVPYCGPASDGSHRNFSSSRFCCTSDRMDRYRAMKIGICDSVGRHPASGFTSVSSNNRDVSTDCIFSLFGYRSLISSWYGLSALTFSVDEYWMNSSGAVSDRAQNVKMAMAYLRGGRGVRFLGVRRSSEW